MSDDCLKSALDNTLRQLGRARRSFIPQFLFEEIGTVTTVSTSIAKVSGLPDVGFEELVEFPNNLFGIAFNLDEDEVGVVLLGDCSALNAGAEVRRTGRVTDVPGAILDGFVVHPRL